MNKKRLMYVVGVSLLLSGGLSACSVAKLDHQLVAEPDPVSLRLAAAMDKASAALATLAAVEQKRYPSVEVQSVPYAPQELRRTVSVDWTGPVEPIAERLAERAGYRFQIQGALPSAPLIISVHAREKSVIEILRDVGLQAGRRADIAVDPQQRVVELNYAGFTGESYE